MLAKCYVTQLKRQRGMKKGKCTMLKVKAVRRRRKKQKQKKTKKYPVTGNNELTYESSGGGRLEVTRYLYWQAAVGPCVKLRDRKRGCYLFDSSASSSPGRCDRQRNDVHAQPVPCTAQKLRKRNQSNIFYAHPTHSGRSRRLARSRRWPSKPGAPSRITASRIYRRSTTSP